ncbi:MAG: hypothetical protein H6831_08290 [Planctomycetes bacterium]|nr:hypothetical protein [Planctomycetota bacterium]MCB9904391.1 hypothetical protein [Planctomycetota bacterium]
MNTLRTLLLAAGLLGASLIPAPAARAERTDFAGFELDCSGRLVEIDATQKGDPRDNLALFGQRPTLVLVSVNPRWNADDIKDYVKTLKRVDKLAAKWEQDGFEVLCIVPQAWMEQKGKKIALDLVDRAKPNHMTCARLDEWDIDSPLDQPVRDELLETRYGSELGFRWALIAELGTIAASGDDVFDKSVEDLRKSLQASPACKDGSTKRCFAALAEWRLGDAEEQLAKLESGAAAERCAAELEELHARLQRAEEHYRKVFCAPLQERGMLAEYVTRLERLAAMFRTESESGSRVSAEVQAIRAQDDYAAAVEQYERYLEMRKLRTELEAAVDSEYDARARADADYDEAAYYAAVAKLYPAAIERLNAYVKEQRDSPYCKTIGIILMDLREELTYAQQSH